MKWWWKFMHWFVFRLRIYVAWSKIYNWLRTRKYRKAWLQYLRWMGQDSQSGGVWDLTPEEERSPRILANLSVPQIDEALRTIEWKADTWRALWDAIVRPEKMLFWISCKKFPPDPTPGIKDPRKDIFYDHGQKQPETEMDCDDFTVAAIWMLQNTLHSYEDRDLHKKQVLHAWFLNVARIEGKSFWGHNVCLVRKTEVDGSVSFFHAGNWGLMGPFPTVAKTIESVRGDLPLVGWAILKPSTVSNPLDPPMKLKLVDRDGKLPPDQFLKEKTDG